MIAITAGATCLMLGWVLGQVFPLRKPKTGLCYVCGQVTLNPDGTACVHD